MLKNRNNRGFTLVQLIVTVSVISILAASVLFNEDVLGRKGKAQDVQRQYDIAAIGKAIELYQIDNDALPSDFSGVSLWTSQKQVLCSSAASLTCDGQTRTCLVVDDVDFLGKYIAALPVDPIKSADTDTGYYIARTGTDMMTFGACDSYNGELISYIAKASLSDHSSTCGDGEVTGSEVCDYTGSEHSSDCYADPVDCKFNYCASNCTLCIDACI